MKCLILAGGRGERLWPLSRWNFPKQFIQIQKNHSLFQETVARNLSYCDEFIVLTNWEYRDIISNQMAAFQGVPYRCIFEEESRKTTAAIVLACLELQPSEYIFVAAADHVIGTDGYKEAILRGKEEAGKGKISIFGKKTKKIDSRFGYLSDGKFYEKPEIGTINPFQEEIIFQNIGLMLFQNGVFLNEIKRLQSEIINQCKSAFERKVDLPDGTKYKRDALISITPIAIEKSLLELTDKLSCIEAHFSWNDVGNLEDLKNTEYVAEGIGIINKGKNSTILNQSSNQAVVVNRLDNVLVVNTTDAVYVGRKGESKLLKGILHNNPELENFSEKGAIIYRQWGYREIIVEEEKYRIQKVTVLPGKTIYEHKHEERIENWTIIQGTALIILDGEVKSYNENDSIEAKAGIIHQISNNGETDLIFIETAVGEVLHHDLIPGEKKAVTESSLGFQINTIVKLAPTYKDYLWGGTKLRDIYGKQCDFDIIAESWELSAHSAGNCIIASGRHKGLTFSKYLETVGKEVLGWKCTPLQSFPLLIKFIDAKLDLSVQVHPYDDYALENENEYGKNEMWYVVNAEPGAGLYIGFNRNVEREEVRRKVTDNTILSVLNFFQTHPGDVFFIPAGTVHAIGAGNLICEIQQSSNCTYRLYDYGRVDKFGNQRELHLSKALDVMNYHKYEPIDIEVEQEEGQKQIRCKYFETSIVSVDGRKSLPLTDDSFRAVLCIKGQGEIAVGDEHRRIKAGESLFIPATNKKLMITGDMSMVISKI